MWVYRPKAYRVKIIDDKIFAYVEDDKRDRYLISCQFNEEKESAFEISKIKVGASSMIRDWTFFDDNKKVAMVFGYSGMRIYDISKLDTMRLIKKRIERGTNSSLAIDISIKDKTVYELRSRELGFYDFIGNEKSSDKSLKNHYALGIDKDKEIVYMLGIVEKTYTLYKYKNYNNNLILLNSRNITIDLGGYNILRHRYLRNMKIYKSKIFIENKNVVYVFDSELKLINKFKVSNLVDFYLNENTIILRHTDGTMKIIDFISD